MGTARDEVYETVDEHGDVDSEEAEDEEAFLLGDLGGDEVHDF